MYIANSFPFLLAATGNSLDKHYSHYEEDLCAGIMGVKKAAKTTPLANGVVLRFHRGCIVDIDSQLNVQETLRHSNLDFQDYRAYEEEVSGVLTRIQSNATDPARCHPYGMISTISRGYDAVATSALAAEIGCKTAITFNAPDKYKPDCGTSIAKVLGYTDIYEVDANRYLNNAQLLEAEACSTGDTGTSIVFTAYEELYRGKLLFMGTRGDSLWGKNHPNVNDDQEFIYGNYLQQSSSAFTENILRNNTIMINVPMIGCDRWTQIDKISSSNEMLPWSTGNGYDRPIPRRIAEDKGVGRKEFGQQKAGAGMSYHFDTLKRMRNKMSPVSYDSLLRYKRSLKRNRLKVAAYSIRYYLHEVPIYLNYICYRLHLPLRFSTRGCGLMSSPISSLLILWGMDVMVQRYKRQSA